MIPLPFITTGKSSISSSREERRFELVESMAWIERPS